MIYFIAHSDIQSKAVELTIASEISKVKKFVYLTATQNLKNLRADSPILSSAFMPYKNDDTEANLYSISDFIQYAAKRTYDSKGYLSNADQKFILAKVIAYYYRENIPMQKTMYQMRYDIFEIVNLLAFSNKAISEEQLQLIRQDYSEIEKDIFGIYALFQDVVAKMIASIACGERDAQLTTILGENFLKNTEIKSIKIFSDKQKEILIDLISKEDVLFFDGFLFFNEIQRFILSAAIELGKSLCFISKQFTDKMGDFIFERNIKEIADMMSTKVKAIKVPNEENLIVGDTAINYAKIAFPLNISDTPPNADELISDGTIKFIQPFISREEELRYVAKSISKQLKDAYKGDISNVYDLLSDIAIVLAVNKEEYEERISNIFREVGLFVLKNDLFESGKYSLVDKNTIKPVYFNRHDFLDTDVKMNDGNSMSYHDKHILFENGFKRIDINRTSRPIASYPVGQFVLELYRTISDGMSIEGFKGILYSNWRYVVDKVQLKWSDFISDFKYIEIFLADKNAISEWCETVNELLLLKNEMADNSLYVYHPLNQISIESLEFFCQLLNELSNLCSQIRGIVGSIDSHLNMLKNVVMKAGNIIGTEDDNLEFEQVILKKMVLAISDIGSSSLMANLDSDYFAQNIRAMLTDWEQQNAVELETTIRLNVVNLENMKKYKYCYFIMCESDKYPRRYYDKFPFTNDVIEILQAERYGIGVVPHEIKGTEYHLELERYLFKNVLDFTTEKLIITYCEKENGNYNKPSIYAVDVANAFGVDIPFVEQDVDNDSEALKFIETPPSHYFDAKSKYTLTELAIFKLCPKLYYHLSVDDNRGTYLSRLQLKFYMEAVLYCDLLRRFMDYNLANEKVYQKGTVEHEVVVNQLFNETCQANIKFFPFFSKYEIEDTIRNVSGKAKGFIENAMKYLKGNTYTVISYQNKQYAGNNYELIIEHDNRVVDYDLKTWRMSQNSTYLEFLVLKTSDNKSELKHYADMIKALDENDPNEDRINLTSRIIAKINIQFDSKRFANDGVKRTDELVSQVCEYDFSKAVAMDSDYCTYCRLNDVCMMQ